MADVPSACSAGSLTMFSRVASAFLVFGLLAGAAQAGEVPIEDGAYTVTYRLELPHLERWAVDKTRTVCISGRGEAGTIPLPVMSDNTPYRTGRDAARAYATYELAPQAFSGRVAMILGAKNMTMTEVQKGRRIGGCDVAGFDRAESLGR
jgi:hypothetical protein